MENFKENSKKNKVIVLGSFFVILLITIIVFLQTFALLETKNEYSTIKGEVSNDSELNLSFILRDENGTEKSLTKIPEGKNYDVTLSCNNGASGTWNYESWGPAIKNLTSSMTKCNITFAPLKPKLSDIVKKMVVTNGTGVYEVSHEDASIESHMNATQINNLKQTEYRYAGINPNNYIKFNNEIWRVIGLVNTPEGSRVKLIRNESIGFYSWDTSDSLINEGRGINEWSSSDLMKLLNSGFESETIGGSLYWNSQSGNCFNGTNLVNTECNFKSIGLSKEAQEKIDRVTWNLGTNGTVNYNLISTKQFYNKERSNNHGKLCTSGTYCTDLVARTTTWKGFVGLISASDYGYATSGGSVTSRESCLEKILYQWSDNTINDCKNNDWLYKKYIQWMLNPGAHASYASIVLMIYDNGSMYDYYTYSTYAVHPSIYLLQEERVLSGDGTEKNPYVLK